MNECIYKAKHDMMEHDLRNLRAEVKDLDVRLRMNENKADVTASKLDTIIESIKRINNKLDELTSQPARRWEKVTIAVITSVLTLILAYVINKSLI